MQDQEMWGDISYLLPHYFLFPFPKTSPGLPFLASFPPNDQPTFICLLQFSLFPLIYYLINFILVKLNIYNEQLNEISIHV